MQTIIVYKRIKIAKCDKRTKGVKRQQEIILLLPGRLCSGCWGQIVFSSIVLQFKVYLVHTLQTVAMETTHFKNRIPWTDFCVISVNKHV